MPYLKIQSNCSIEAPAAKALMQQASRLVADELGKPEQYIMIDLEPPRPMLFAGSDAPTAYLELKSIGLPAAHTASLSASLCGLLHDVLGVAPERVYIEFADAPRAMWGWNGGTF